MVKEMDRQPNDCGTDLLNQISILDAIYWINNSWNEVESSTISKCFVRCGFELPSTDESSSDSDDDLPLSALKLSH